MLSVKQNSMVLEAIIAHKNEASRPEIRYHTPLYHSSNLAKIAFVVAEIQG